MMVYPVPGRAARDPVTKHVLTEAGLEVSEHDIFWARRVRDGDVTTTAPTPTNASAQPAPGADHAGGEQS